MLISDVFEPARDRNKLCGSRWQAQAPCKVAVAESKLIVVVALPYRHHLREEWKRKMSAPRVRCLYEAHFAGLASLLHSRTAPATSATSAVMLAWSRTKRNLHPKKGT
jgi:hypothetical protein